MDSNVTVLVQGPLNRISLEKLHTYKTVGPVVLSYWAGDDENLYHDIDMDGIDKVRGIVDNVVTNNYRQGTADKQFWGVWNGLKLVKTPYVIRTRSDEYFGNLQPLIDKLNENKIICGSIFFRPWDYMQCHPGDHVFIGATSWLLEAYRLLIESAEQFKGLFCAEQSLAYAIMAVRGYSNPVPRNVFRQFFDVIDINMMKPFIAQYRSGGTTYHNEFNVDVVSRTEQI